ncbi:MAG: ATP-grasp domain-containing protein [Calditrichaceae bacterium]|nr:ATP-grasp domain-containing protein [Calditrichaceae bacterium]
MIRYFKNILKHEAIDGTIHCGDYQRTAPALLEANFTVQLPSIFDENYISYIKEYAVSNKINIIIPLLDYELNKLSAAKQDFLNSDIIILISEPIIIDYGQDKRNTKYFFEKAGLLTPNIFDKVENIQNYPVFLKPAKGSASIGAKKVSSYKDLSFNLNEIDDPIIQEYIDGTEYTIDAWFDLQGHLKCIVPRRRIEVRSGEVSKGITEKDNSIISDVQKLTKSYQGFLGCITFQCIKTENSDNYFIEMNPRFGGGIPLSIAAGANFPKALIYDFLGNKTDEEFYKWKNGLAMLRYDQGLYIQGKDIGL